MILSPESTIYSEILELLKSELTYLHCLSSNIHLKDSTKKIFDI